jgi:hypothetical protein
MNYKKVGEISILQIKSCDNLTGLFTKSLPLATFDKCMKDIGIKICDVQRKILSE